MAKRAPAKRRVKPLTLVELQEQLRITQEAVVALQGVVDDLKAKTPQKVTVEPTTNPALLWLGRYTNLGDCTEQFIMYHIGARKELPTLPTGASDINNLYCLFHEVNAAKGTLATLGELSPRWCFVMCLWPQLVAMQKRNPAYMEKALRELAFMANNAYGPDCK